MPATNLRRLAARTAMFPDHCTAQVRRDLEAMVGRETVRDFGADRAMSGFRGGPLGVRSQVTDRRGRTVAVTVAGTPLASWALGSDGRQGGYRIPRRGTRRMRVGAGWRTGPFVGGAWPGRRTWARVLRRAPVVTDRAAGAAFAEVTR